jgi:type II secretory pathway pseudopilin PulG
MLSRKSIVSFVVLGFLAVLLVGQLQSQQRQGRMNREEMQKRMLERMKEDLQVTDKEWTVIEPRLTKVWTLSRQTRMGDMRFSGRGARGQDGNRGQRSGEGQPDQTAQTAREQTPMEKIAEALRTALEDKTTKPDEIKEKLTALREAREKARQELAKAQQQLQEVLTSRQEAQLVLMGMLN